MNYTECVGKSLLYSDAAKYNLERGYTMLASNYAVKSAHYYHLALVALGTA